MQALLHLGRRQTDLVQLLMQAPLQTKLEVLRFRRRYHRTNLDLS